MRDLEHTKLDVYDWVYAEVYRTGYERYKVIKAKGIVLDRYTDFVESYLVYFPEISSLHNNRGDVNNGEDYFKLVGDHCCWILEKEIKEKYGSI